MVNNGHTPVTITAAGMCTVPVTAYGYGYDRNNTAVDRTKDLAHGTVRLVPHPYGVRSTVVRIRIVSRR